MCAGTADHRLCSTMCSPPLASAWWALSGQPHSWQCAETSVACCYAPRNNQRLQKLRHDMHSQGSLDLYKSACKQHASTASFTDHTVVE